MERIQHEWQNAKIEELILFITLIFETDVSKIKLPSVIEEQADKVYLERWAAEYGRPWMSGWRLELL